MKAPNEIFIHEGMLGLIATEKRVKKSDIAYIRKSALLDLLRKKEEDALALSVKLCYRTIFEEISKL